MAASTRHGLSPLRLLLENGISPNIKDKYGATPLHLAAWTFNNFSVPILLDFGASSSIKDGMGASVVEIAQYTNNFLLLKILLERKVNYGI
jgi:ankyrin repeat protein